MNLLLWDKINLLFLDHFSIIFDATIDGHLPSGKNNYKLSGKTMYKSSEITNYEKSFFYQIPKFKQKWKIIDPIESDVAIICKVVFRDRRRDVDTILLCDLLQKFKVIKNDRQIKLKVINGIDVDKIKPCVNFALFKL
jgi:Holliday junction resolvase RusA-like endonuclease